MSAENKSWAFQMGKKHHANYLKELENSQLKMFLVIYSGSWFGGKAMVVANDKQEAIDLVKSDGKTENFEHVSVEQIMGTGPRVLYNDNGDY